MCMCRQAPGGPGGQWCGPARGRALLSLALGSVSTWAKGWSPWHSEPTACAHLGLGRECPHRGQAWPHAGMRLGRAAFLKEVGGVTLVCLRTKEGLSPVSAWDRATLQSSWESQWTAHQGTGPGRRPPAWALREAGQRCSFPWGPLGFTHSCAHAAAPRTAVRSCGAWQSPSPASGSP